MKAKSCETCNAFVSNAQKNQDGSIAGECRANPPIILAKWFTPQGSGWQAGWPPTNTAHWCRGYEAKHELSVVKEPA